MLFIHVLPPDTYTFVEVGSMKLRTLLAVYPVLPLPGVNVSSPAVPTFSHDPDGDVEKPTLTFERASVQSVLDEEAFPSVMGTWAL